RQGRSRPGVRRIFWGRSGRHIGRCIECRRSRLARPRRSRGRGSRDLGSASRRSGRWPATRPQRHLMLWSHWLNRIERKINTTLGYGEKLMAAIDDLNAAVSALQSEVGTIGTQMDTLMADLTAA